MRPKFSCIDNGEIIERLKDFPEDLQFYPQSATDFNDNCYSIDDLYAFFRSADNEM